jgi:hypothetical protein
MFNICAPAFIYVIFSLTHIIIDTFKGLYNTAFFKFIVSILVTILLDGLCKGGMGVIAWVIVFIPFIFMTVIVSILLYVFGLDIATGKLDLQCSNNPNIEANENTIIVKTPQVVQPVLLPPPSHQTTTVSVGAPTVTTSNNPPPLFYTTDPAYQS